MQKLLSVYKEQGFTPLETIKKLKEQFPEYKNKRIGYAGRLDPLAHGILLLMIGEETTKQRDAYLNLPKEYEFEVVFGMQTDTYDVLGILQNEKVIANDPPAGGKQSQIQKIESFINSKLGKQIQYYPPYSSKTVNGKPLYWWARQNKLSEIQIPKRTIEIFDLKLMQTNRISATELQKVTTKQINLVTGDFRQEEIKKTWEDFFQNNKTPEFQTARFTIACSSGTYVRSLVNELGRKLGTGALTLEILRIKVGDYTLQDSLFYKR